MNMNDPALARTQQRARHSGAKRHTTRRGSPSRFNGHDSNRRKRTGTSTTPQGLAPEDAPEDGYGGDQKAQNLAAVAARWARDALDLSDPVTIDWGGKAQDLEGWGEYVPSKGLVKLATNFPTPGGLVRTLFHELVHAGQNEGDDFPPRYAQTSEQTRAQESEADALAAKMLDDFLDATDLPRSKVFSTYP